MSVWLYQMNQKDYTPSRYRLDIWEGQRWNWDYGNKYGKSNPQPGDRVFFYYTPSKGDDSGIYGWAIISSSYIEEKRIYFIPVSPSDILKMYPYWNTEVKNLIDSIRPVNQGTLYQVTDEIKEMIFSGILKWVYHNKDGV